MGLAVGDPAKILVVDDELINRRVLEAMLLPLGHQVYLAQDGFSALDMVEETPFDLILLDVMMPGMDGFEVARRLKEDSRHTIIPIVMVTALKEVEDRVRALESGADDFLTKPVDKTELRARVRSSLKIKAYNDHMLNYQQVLEATVAERTRDLENAFRKVREASLDTIHRLSQAAEYKDEDTGSHIARLSQYAACLARGLGLNQETVERILYASPMHDVGKIGIPDHILLKPGKLDGEEWEVMMTHTTIGGRILGGAEPGFLKLAEVIAMTHHEKWDGSGYPAGLSGSRIPLAGRVVAVADVFDALTTRRPYKEPFGLEKSLAIMKEGRGRHFDPKVLDSFLENLDEILEIRKKYQDDGVSHLVRLTQGLRQSSSPTS